MFSHVCSRMNHPQEIVGKKTQKKSLTEKKPGKKTQTKNPDKKNPEIFLHVYLGVFGPGVWVGYDTRQDDPTPSFWGVALNCHFGRLPFWQVKMTVPK